MNALHSWVVDRGLAAGTVEGILARISLVLAAAWLAHAALARVNPRWRVLTWRVAAVAVLMVPAVTFCGPTISLCILPPEKPIQRAALEAVRPAFHRSPRERLQTRSQFVAELPQVAAKPQPEATHTAIQPRAGANESTAPAREIDWLRLALAIWIVGVALGVVGEVFAWLRLRALRRRSQPVSSEITSLASTIAARLGCRQTFEIRRTRDLESPCVYGMLRPVILVPEIDCLPEQREALPAILSHETSHLLSFDLLWNGLLRLLARLLWFHPLMWCARSAHLAACDAVCDATTANLLGDVVGYGRILAQLALRQASANTVLAVPMVRPSSVRCRIEALHRRLYSARLSRTAMMASIAAGLALAGFCGALSITRATASPIADGGLSVSGRVLNEQSEPIPGATVYVYTRRYARGDEPLLSNVLRRLRQADDCWSRWAL